MTIFDGAVYWNEVTESFCAAGYSRDEALVLTQTQMWITAHHAWLAQTYGPRDS